MEPTPLKYQSLSSYIIAFKSPDENRKQFRSNGGVEATLKLLGEKNGGHALKILTALGIQGIMETVLLLNTLAANRV